MRITLGSEYISKNGSDEVSGLVLLGGYFEVTWFGNIEGSGHVEGDTLGNLEGTRVGNKLGIYYGEGLGITLRVSDRSKLGGD